MEERKAYHSLDNARGWLQFEGLLEAFGVAEVDGDVGWRSWQLSASILVAAAWLVSWWRCVVAILIVISVWVIHLETWYVVACL